MKKLTTFLLFALAFVFTVQAYTSTSRPFLSLPGHDAYSVSVNGTDYPIQSARLVLAEPHPRRYHLSEKTSVPVDAALFSALLERIKHAAFDRYRYAIAKQAVAAKGMNAEQIATIARLFTFDHYRLDFAQFAYRYCHDPEHYVQVAQTLTFQSNVRKLYAYMNR